MEDKICIDIFIPSINKSYDIVLSSDLVVRDAAEYIIQVIREYEDISFETKGVILCDIAKKCILNGNFSLKKSGIKDGSRLMAV